MLTSNLLAYALFGYLAGSIPFGLILTDVSGHPDIRKAGSGNIGAANVLISTGSYSLSLLTLALDASKGFVFVVVADYFGQPDRLVEAINMIAPVLGHCFPVWLRFKGGKGIATAAGVLLASSFPLGIICLVAWTIALWSTRYVSIAVMASAVAGPLFGSLSDSLAAEFAICAISIVILARHRTNFSRLLKGNERKIDTVIANIKALRLRRLPE